ncbi:MAG: putative 4-hydroxybenzoate polyprenyltransferase [Chlamydiia bacterium]|nr:putative 4-hydroxybenzoate polyprenyltransferase [Chlamydiia bacterium]
MKLLQLTAFKQIIFGLPLMISGVLLGIYSHPEAVEFNFKRGVLIFLAFLFARSSGMTFNQLIDRKIDEKNLRTQNRLIPSGGLSPRNAALVAWTTLIAFILCCQMLGKTCFFLSFFAAFLLIFYSFTKRFTSLCHFVLGCVHLLSPLMAAAACTHHLSFPAFVLGIASFCLISGNDIIYAIQDVTFDKGHLLHSIPVRIGEAESIKLATILHVATCLLLGCLGLSISSVFLTLSLPLLTGFILWSTRKFLFKKDVFHFFFWSNALVSSIILLLILIVIIPIPLRKLGCRLRQSSGFERL